MLFLKLIFFIVESLNILKILSWKITEQLSGPVKLRNLRETVPIIRSFHLPYLLSESTLSRIFLFSEAPPTGFFAGVCIIANHKRAVVFYCLRHMLAAGKYFSNGEKRGEFTIFLGCYANVSVFSREIKEPPTYLSSTNKKIRDRVDSRVRLVWRFRVMGSWWGVGQWLKYWPLCTLRITAQFISISDVERWDGPINNVPLSGGVDVDETVSFLWRLSGPYICLCNS